MSLGINPNDALEQARARQEAAQRAKEEAEAKARQEALERQRRGIESNIRTSYKGILKTNEDSFKRKKLLGE